MHTKAYLRFAICTCAALAANSAAAQSKDKKPQPPANIQQLLNLEGRQEESRWNVTLLNRQNKDLSGEAEFGDSPTAFLNNVFVLRAIVTVPFKKKADLQVLKERLSKHVFLFEPGLGSSKITVTDTIDKIAGRKGDTFDILVQVPPQAEGKRVSKVVANVPPPERSVKKKKA